MMRNTGSDKERLACRAVKGFTIYYKFPAAPRDKVELILIVIGLVIGPSRGKENQSHPVLLKRFHIPDTFLPFLCRRKRQVL